MIEIFLPIVFMCLNDICNFMQSNKVFKLEIQCKLAIDNQKKYMLEIASQAGQPKITMLEGTCINAKVSTGIQI